MKLQIDTSKSAKDAEKYFSERLEAYFSKDGQEFIGEWGGKGAAMLGLQGQVTQEAFVRLLNNHHPFTDEQLTERMREDRRPGFQMVWGVPKSVSLAYAKTKDERIIQAIRETVWETAMLAEEQAAVRVRVGDKNRDEDRVTKNLIWAEYIHLTARPQDGYSDPHAHVHLYVMNISWDQEEEKWKALQMGRIKEMAGRWEKMGGKLLQEKLEALGLELEPSETGYEIKGFTRDIVEKFSRRTMTIEETADRLGITDPAQKAKLGAMTREKKIENVLMSDFEPFWWANPLPGEEAAFKDVQERLNRSRAKEFGEQIAIAPEGVTKIEAEPAAMKSALGQKSADWARERVNVNRSRRATMNEATRPQAVEKGPVVVTEHDRRAVAMASEHLLERQSVVRDYDVVAEATNHWYLGRTTLAGLWQAVAEAPLLRRERDGWLYMTTPEVMAEEARIVEKCLAGKGRFEPVNEYWKIRDEELNEQQRAAVLHVLNSTDFITGIKGDPGVGKTRVLQEIKRGAEAGMWKILALAPWAATAHHVLKEAGFENAETVAALLVSGRLQEVARGAVWLVDEAALLSTREADRLIALAERLEARLVPVGDCAQHLPVERGQAYRLLEEDGKMATARITEIQRQKGEYRRAVELALAKRTREAFNLLDEMGSIVEMPLEERKAALGLEYYEALERGETVGILAPTHRERREMMEGVRAVLKEKGVLKEARVHRLNCDLNWSATQKSDPAQYRRGLLVQINEPVKGFRMGERLEVVGVRDDMVRVRSLNPNETKTRPLPLEMSDAFSVLEPVETKKCEREVLRNLGWTEPQKSDPEHYKAGMVAQINCHLKGFALGEQLEVIRVAEDGVKVRDSGGRHKMLPVGVPKAFTVHERETIEICEGELIRITANGRTADRHRLTNGMTYKVDYIGADGALVLENGLRLDERFKNLEWGYAATSHASQGRTFDRILIAQSAEMSAGASDMRQLIVSITRGSKGVKMFVDDKERVLELVSRERECLMATELFREDERPEIRPKSSALLGQLDRSPVLEIKEPERELGICL